MMKLKVCRVLFSRFAGVLLAACAVAPLHAADSSQPAISYTVVFHASEKGATVSQSFRYGQKKALQANTFRKDGCFFIGWSRTVNGAVAYTDGQVVHDLASTSGAKVHLYAQWAVRKYIVRFNANGGTGKIADQLFAYGKATPLRANAFKRKGYAFLGWSKSAKAKKATYKNRKAVKNLSKRGGVVVLYAVWNKLGKKNVVLCLGDSITKGIRCEGLPYPTRLAKLSGRKVVNYGNGGKTSAYGVSIAKKALIAEGPGTVCILFGANDAGQNVHHAVVRENLRTIIRLCKKYKATPIIATPTPQIWKYARNNDNVKVIAAEVRRLSREEHVTLVDLNVAFENGKKYLNPIDGLHLSEAGGKLMARMFYEALPR